MAEIHQQSQPEPRNSQIIANLRLMFRSQVRNGFDFNDHLVKANEIRLVGLPQSQALVLKFQLTLFLELQLSQLELPGQSFLIYLLQKTRAERSLHLETRTLNGVGFFLVNYLHFFVNHEFFYFYKPRNTRNTRKGFGSGFKTAVLKIWRFLMARPASEPSYP